MQKQQTPSDSSPGADAVFKFVLYVILTITGSLTFLVFIRALAGPGLVIQLPMLVPPFLFFSSLVVLKHRGDRKVQTIYSVFVLSIFYIFGLFTLVKWGFDAPQGLLTLALASILHALLFYGSSTWRIYTLLGAIYLIISILQLQEILTPSVSWKQSDYSIVDTILYLTTVTLIFVSAWIFNRQQSLSFVALKAAEKLLHKQNYELEAMVRLRTRQLREEHEKRLNQVHEFVVFGRDISGILHDVINPITAMSLQIENLEKKSLLGKEIDVLRKSISKVNGLVRTAKLRSATSDLLEVTNVYSIAEEVIRTVHHRAISESIDISLKGKNISVKSNPLSIYKVIQSLVINGLDACAVTKRKHKSVELRIKNSNTGLCISVKDNGCGILAKNLKSIFVPYYSTKSANGNLGLGLSISKQLVEDVLGGTITVRSVIGKGTEFKILIPNII